MNRKNSLQRVHVLFAAFLFALISTSLVILADDAPPPWVVPARAARKKNPIDSSDASIAAGKTIYVAQCLKCHGDAGKGDGQSSKDLKVKPKDLSDPTVASQTDGALFYKITNGRSPMPTFEKLISDDDRWNVVIYIRTLEPMPATQPDATSSATQPANGQ
jgi:mono/diheme cytochrome c family protein